MNVASLELCKELYELSGLSDTDKWYMETNNGGEHVVGYRHSRPRNKTFPAYDLGFLFQQLKEPVSEIRFVPQMNGKWLLLYTVSGETEDYELFADTPEDAACKLACELFKQKVLRKQ